MLHGIPYAYGLFMFLLYDVLLRRIRKGPAPSNLTVPTYQFVTDTSVLIG